MQLKYPQLRQCQRDQGNYPMTQPKNIIQKIYYTFCKPFQKKKNATRQIFRAERLSGHKYHDHVPMFCDQESKWIQMPIIMSCAVKFNFTINKFLFDPQKEGKKGVSPQVI